MGANPYPPTLPELTRAEEQVMRLVWQLGPCFVKDVRAALPTALATTTVSTLVRLLAQKGFVGHEAFGRTHRYFPLIGQDAYRQSLLNKLISTHFDGSFGALLSFYTQAAGLDAAQLGQLVGQAYQQLGQAAAPASAAARPTPPASPNPAR